jgi:hypothetical protein
MLTRIRPQIIRPWIKRPRGIAILLAAVVILTNSSVYAQRCGGASGGTGLSPGSAGAGGFGIAGGPGGTGAGFGNPAATMQAAQMQRMQQAFFNVPSTQGVDPDDHRVYLAARKAYRAAQAEQRKKRLALRAEKQTRQVASRSRPSTVK